MPVHREQHDLPPAPFGLPWGSVSPRVGEFLLRALSLLILGLAGVLAWLTLIAESLA